jgi:hypothetical protein
VSSTLHCVMLMKRRLEIHEIKKNSAYYVKTNAPLIKVSTYLIIFIISGYLLLLSKVVTATKIWIKICKITLLINALTHKPCTRVSVFWDNKQDKSKYNSNVMKSLLKRIFIIDHLIMTLSKRIYCKYIFHFEIF